MTTPEDIRATVAEYCRRYTDDRDGWLALFADDATVEDPVGSDVLRGKAAIGEFWDMTHAMADRVTLTPTSYVKVAGNEAAFAMDARMESADGANGMGIIDTMTFDDDGRITSQRAYWDFGDIAPVD